MRAVLLIGILCLSGCELVGGSWNCDYVIQWDATFQKYYIYKCFGAFRNLKIGYGSFSTEESAIRKVREIRAKGSDPKVQTRFIEVTP
jgi:hypothetical protein